MVVDAARTAVEAVGVRQKVYWRACRTCDEFAPLPPGLDDCRDCDSESYLSIEFVRGGGLR